MLIFLVCVGKSKFMLDCYDPLGAPDGYIKEILDLFKEGSKTNGKLDFMNFNIASPLQCTKIQTSNLYDGGFCARIIAGISFHYSFLLDFLHFFVGFKFVSFYFRHSLIIICAFYVYFLTFLELSIHILSLPKNQKFEQFHDLYYLDFFSDDLQFCPEGSAILTMRKEDAELVQKQYPDEFAKFYALDAAQSQEYLLQTFGLVSEDSKEKRAVEVSLSQFRKDFRALPEPAQKKIYSRFKTSMGVFPEYKEDNSVCESILELSRKFLIDDRNNMKNPFQNFFLDLNSEKINPILLEHIVHIVDEIRTELKVKPL